MLCGVLSGGGKCCSPVMCACVCAVSSSSQVVAVSGPFRPVTSSAPVVSGGTVAAERSPPICEGELCGLCSPSVRPGWSRPIVVWGGSPLSAHNTCHCLSLSRKNTAIDHLSL